MFIVKILTIWRFLKTHGLITGHHISVVNRSLASMEPTRFSSILQKVCIVEFSITFSDMLP